MRIFRNVTFCLCMSVNVFNAQIIGPTNLFETDVNDYHRVSTSGSIIWRHKNKTGGGRHSPMVHTKFPVLCLSLGGETG